MKDSDPGRRSELTDTQLDQLLAETNRELLENVEATSDLSRTLTTIMSRSARRARASGRATHGLGQALAAIMRSAPCFCRCPRSAAPPGASSAAGRCGSATPRRPRRWSSWRRLARRPAQALILAAPPIVVCLRQLRGDDRRQGPAANLR